MHLASMCRYFFRCLDLTTTGLSSLWIRRRILGRAGIWAGAETGRGEAVRTCAEGVASLTTRMLAMRVEEDAPVHQGMPAMGAEDNAPAHQGMSALGAED